MYSYRTYVPHKKQKMGWTTHSSPHWTTYAYFIRLRTCSTYAYEVRTAVVVVLCVDCPTAHSSMHLINSFLVLLVLILHTTVSTTYCCNSLSGLTTVTVIPLSSCVKKSSHQQVQYARRSLFVRVALFSRTIKKVAFSPSKNGKCQALSKCSIRGTLVHTAVPYSSTPGGVLTHA